MKTIKNVFLLSIFVILVMLVTSSCEKDPINPINDPDPIDHPTSITIKPTMYLDVTPSLDTIPYGYGITVSWSVKDAKNVMLNDSVVSLLGTIETVRLFEDTTYELFASNGDSINTIKRQIKVGDWKTSGVGRLTHSKPWMLESIEVYQGGKKIDSFILNEEQKTNLLYFYIKGTYLGNDYDYVKNNTGMYEFKHKSGEVFGNGVWSLSEDETRLLKWNRDIIVLSQDKFIIDTDEGEYLYNGKPCIYRETYYRPK